MWEFITRQLFLTVLSLSLSGTLIGLFIAAVRPFTGTYFSKKWNYYIWLLVIVRLLIPFHFSFGFLKPLDFHAALGQNVDMAQTGRMIQSDGKKQADSSAQLDDIQDAASVLPENTLTAPLYNDSKTAPPQSETHLPVTEPKEAVLFHFKLSAENIWNFGGCVWFIGALFAIFIKLLNYHTYKKELKKNCTRITDNRILTIENVFCAKLHIEKAPPIYENAAVSSPMTIGLWTPMIILPKISSDNTVPAFSRDDQNLSHFQLILHHELIHVAQRDLLYKWVSQLLLCVHWFNPVLHRIGRQINRDCELSCDEAILSELTETGKQMYGNILLDTAELNIARIQNTFATTLLENKKDLKRRLDGILHYKKATRFRFVLSVCAFALILTLSACSTVWISSDSASTSESKRDTFVSKSSDSSVTASDAAATKDKEQLLNNVDFDSSAEDSDWGSDDFVSNEESFHYDDTDETGTFMQMFSSLVSADSYVNSFVSPDRSSDAWNVYGDDALLAEEDMRDTWGAFNYMNNSQKLLAYGFVLYGSDSFLIVYAEQDTDVKIKSSFQVNEGNFKIISIAPDKSIVTLNDTGAEITKTITMKKGRNVLKMVGQGAKVTHLEIDFSDLNESEFDNVFYSEEEEYVHLAKNATVPIDKDRIMDALCYLDENEASALFHTMLTAGTSFTADELCDFLIYSDATLSSQYLLEALRNQTIEPLSADTASELMLYLDSSCQTEVFKTLPVEDFYDTFADNIYYLDNSQIEECLTDYIERGGTLTYSMYDEISPYLNESTRKKLDKLIQK